MKAEILRLRKLVESQAETIKLLECRATADTSAPGSAGPGVAPISEMDRESIITALSRWRSDHGVSDPQRYLRNRSTDQLRKMYIQVHQAGSVGPHNVLAGIEHGSEP